MGGSKKGDQPEELAEKRRGEHLEDLEEFVDSKQEGGA